MAGRLLHIVLMYGALRYSLKDLEDAISYKMENVTKKVPIDSGDPILISASILLQRIEKVKEFVSRKHGSNDRFLKMDVDSIRSQIFVEQLSRLEVLVKRAVKSHVVNKVYIIRNKELLAKVDNMLLNLDKEK